MYSRLGRLGRGPFNRERATVPCLDMSGRGPYFLNLTRPDPWGLGVESFWSLSLVSSLSLAG